MSNAERSTVVIADDDPGIRDALAALIAVRPSLLLVGVGSSGFEAVDLCTRLLPSVAVVDVMMPGGGRDAVVGIRLTSPNTAIVVYTARSDRRTRTRMLEAGASLVVVKGGGDDLAVEIERAAALGVQPAAEAGSFE